MKRFRKMVKAASLTEMTTKGLQHPEYRVALLKRLPAQLFGETIAAHITVGDIDEERICLHIPDDAWRKEMKTREKFILVKAREIQSSLRFVDILP